MDKEAPVEPPSFLKKRFETEQFVLAAALCGVRTIVLRVPEVYGRGSGIHLTEPFKLARQMGVALYVGKGEHRWSTVHVEDLAELYVLALERASVGLLFNARSGEVTMKAQAESISRNLGFDGQTRSVTVEEMLEIGGPIYAATYATNCRVLGDKAKRLLGWMPKSPSLFEEIEYGSYVTGAQTK